MKKNMGQFDRVVRVILALTAIFLFYNKIITGTAAIVLMIVAAVFILTSLVAVCPLYTLLGIRTCQAKHA
ncbi:YgaP family membrane protein [Chitinophaga ginsengisoli]|uniref:Inner membrane protein YgaP-like transmembrane domain-containing protein n=1 Tax=Chitinophaga ginsengisoli TaxID=363837 RepID=A0A2P8GL25_9BACT|nr:DUF2892 domain-containing protein [Chitinophaga ginsengisoli]PSL34673.1 Protein of unknown function (DUF2892) [Chitinophaga ginsengisoli]